MRAGHAVVGIWQGVRVHSISIVPDRAERTLGHVRRGRWSRTVVPDVYSHSPRVRRYCESQILFSFAGVIAERSASPRRRYNWVGADQDIRFADDLISYVASSPR